MARTPKTTKVAKPRSTAKSTRAAAPKTAPRPKADTPAPKPVRRTAPRRATAKRSALSTTAWSLGAVALGLSAVAAGAFAWARLRIGNAEHEAPDLEGDSHPDGTGRAPDAFRPDPTAKVPKSEREGLRPATLGADRDL